MAESPLANPARRKVRVIVEMYGGTIQTVYLEKKDVDIELDMVFTESPKYGSGEDSEVEVQKGPLEGSIIYTQLEGSHIPSEENEQVSAELFEGVFDAAQARRNPSKEPDENADGGKAQEAP